MRQILVLVMLVLCSLNIIAQEQKDYQFFINMIDSLKTEYSVKEFINRSVVKLPYQYKDYFSDLSENGQNRVLDYISELYNQTEYLGLYGLAGVLLDEYYSSSKDNVTKRMIEINFDKICYMSSEVVDFGHSKYYTQYAKDRLLEIAEKRWNEEDIKAWTILITQTLNIDSYKRDVKKIMRETNRQGEDVENYLLDSLVHKGIEKNLQANMNRPIYKRCIMIIGSLNDQRFIPALESMLEEYKDRKDYPEIKKACTYALAKLGVQKYIDEVYNSEYIPYRYLGTKEAFLKYLDKKFVWNVGAVVFSNEKYRPSALAVLDEALYYRYLKNVPPEIDQELWSIITNYVIPENFADYVPDKDEQNRESIQKAYHIYNWIKENQEVWEIPAAKDEF
jgi:hypothetical protein